MDLTTLFHNLREEVSCSVCSDLFTDPKQLSCLHSFCLKCVNQWYETCGGGDAIKCPKCQTLSRIPVSGDLKDLPTSFYLNGFIDVLAIKECKNTQLTASGNVCACVKLACWEQIVMAESCPEALSRENFLHTQSTADMSYSLDTLVKPCWSVMYGRRTI